jgi:hypothetical protein
MFTFCTVTSEFFVLEGPGAASGPLQSAVHTVLAYALEVCACQAVQLGRTSLGEPPQQGQCLLDLSTVKGRRHAWYRSGPLLTSVDTKKLEAFEYCEFYPTLKVCKVGRSNIQVGVSQTV